LCYRSRHGDAVACGTVISAYRLVRPGGTLLTAALGRSRGYVVVGKTFPSPDVDASDVRAVLEPCLSRGNLTVESCDLAGQGSHGYASIVLVRALRRAGAATAGR
jgi:hypothetical protein